MAAYFVCNSFVLLTIALLVVIIKWVLLFTIQNLNLRPSHRKTHGIKDIISLSVS